MKRQQRTSQSSAVVVALALMLGSVGLLAATAAAAPQFTTQFALDECSWSSNGRNQYFTLRPGDWFLLEGEEEGEVVRVQIKVLSQTKRITFQRGRVFSKEQLVEHLHRSDSDVSSNVVEVLVSGLRKKIHVPGEPPILRTRRGFGYFVE
jgi:DNA-binding response OmpR family regulator